MNYRHLPIYRSYLKSPYSSIKHSSYFQVYSDLFTDFKNKKIVFVEIGILNGGSLFMWRNFFGKKARIIGIDRNPKAKHWERLGFEIFIGDQADPNFWSKFFSTVGHVDIILDDGGHTYRQQIVTACHCIPNLRDKGLLVIEDTHTSYFSDFGYPSRYSFTNWAKKVSDNLYNRFPTIKNSSHEFYKYVYSITFFESIISFSIDRKKCFISKPTKNNGKFFNAEDYRYKGSLSNYFYSFKSFFVESYPFLTKNILFKKIAQTSFKIIFYLFAKKDIAGLKKYF